jgi:hypothetical protein
MNAVVSFITALRERPRLLMGIFLFILGAVVFYDFLAERHEPHFAGDRIRGFWALFGVVGAVFMTKFMKGIGHAFLMQPTDFYSKSEKGEE